MKTIKLNALEVKALQALLDNSFGCCRGTCAFPEMESKNIECNDCPFTKAVDSIDEKIG